jgi:hypothetical protein
MAAAQGAGDREALTDLSVIYRDGIGVAADANESMRWAAVLSLADNIASGAQVLQQLGYPRGFTGVVMSSSSAAAASMDTTPVVNAALVTSLQQPPGFPASLFSCCFQTSVRRARSHPPSTTSFIPTLRDHDHSRTGHTHRRFHPPSVVNYTPASISGCLSFCRPVLHTQLLLQARIAAIGRVFPRDRVLVWGTRQRTMRSSHIDTVNDDHRR